jgi:hypothetical protein
LSYVEKSIEPDAFLRRLKDAKNTCISGRVPSSGIES